MVRVSQVPGSFRSFVVFVGMLWMTSLTTIVALGAGVEFQPGRYSEFIIAENGDVVLFPERTSDNPKIYRDGTWQESPPMVWEGTIHDAVRTEMGTWLVLSQASPEEAVIYEWTGETLKERSRLTGLFHQPVLYDGGDGTVWVTSREGRAYMIGPTGTEAHEFGPAIKKDDHYAYYPPTLSIKTKEHGIWFWSHVEHESLNSGGVEYLAIEGFHVYQDGAWRVVPHSEGKLGGVVEFKDGTLYCGARYKDFFSLSPADGGVTNLDWRLPNDEHCIFLHRLGRSGVLGITARPSMFNRLHPEKAGWVGSLFAVVQGEVRELLDGVDFGKVYHDKGRPALTMEDGVLLAAGNAGLVFVSNDAHRVFRLDWRYGIPTSNIDRMRAAGDQLFLLDRRRGFAVVSWRELSSSPPTAGIEAWDVAAIAASPTLSSDGAVWYLVATCPAVLRCAKGKEVAEYAVPDTLFPVKNLWYLACDSRDRIWLISDFETHKTAVLDKGVWRAFDLRETAYSTFALEETGNPAYRIGDPSQHCFPAFSGDGRVAYQNEWWRICYFDGKEWSYGYSTQEIVDGWLPDAPPFYHGGILTVKIGDIFYQNIDGKWEPTYENVENPYGERPRERHRIDLPVSFPGESRHPQICVNDNIGTIWAGDTSELYYRFGDVWMEFPTEDTPLRMADDISDILVGDDGSLYFTLTGGDYRRLAHHTPHGQPPALSWVEQPPDTVKIGTMHFSALTDASNGPRFIRARFDNGEWKNVAAQLDPLAFTFYDLKNGEHTFQVQAFDSLLRPARELAHTFTVARDYDDETSLLLTQLGSADYADRESAAQSLIKMGPVALRQIDKLEGERPELAWWLKAIRQGIERNRTANKSVGGTQ